MAERGGKMEKYDFDLIIIGGGPGGYVAAIRAAQLGAKVCLVERQRLGGTCLNWGCIPTKALYRSAEVCHLAKNSEEFGIVSHVTGINWEQVQSRKKKIVDQLVGGIDQLMKSNGITVVAGEAKFIGHNEVSVRKADGGDESISSEHIIIATGSKPAVLPIEGADLPDVLDSTSLLAIDHIPQRLAIIGGGVIGMEFADIFNAFGSKVTVIEFLPGILAQLDSDLSKRMAPMMKKKGIEILTASKVMKIEKQDEMLLTVSTAKGEIKVAADKVLMATGRKPVTEGLMLENAGVAYDRKGIGTNSYGQTNVPHIYAIGDVTGGIMLAHTASHQGITAVEHMMGLKPHQNVMVVPSCVFTFPEIASAGMTEDEARTKGIAYKTGKFMFGANGKALTLGEGEGLLKVISDENNTIIGVHILGPHASDLVHEGVLAIGMKLSADDIIGTIHAHPTLGEVFSEAVMGLEGIALHAAPVKKI
ncbi:MAG: dihydrolipoyl dehydrogenase [Caulobacteraceae bacterium]